MPSTSNLTANHDSVAGMQVASTMVWLASDRESVSKLPPRDALESASQSEDTKPPEDQDTTNLEEDLAIRELRIKLKEIFGDSTNTSDPGAKRLSWDGRPSGAISTNRSRGGSILEPTPAEMKQSWRSGRGDPQCQGSNSSDWRQKRDVRDNEPLEKPSGIWKSRSRGSSVSNGLQANGRKQRATESRT